MTVSSRFTGGSRSRSKRSSVFTRLMNSACFFRRSTAGGAADRARRRAQPAVRIGGLQRRLDHPLVSCRAGDRQPDASCAGPPLAVMHLQRQRRLAEQQPPPPAAKQALVQRPEHRHHGLGARRDRCGRPRPVGARSDAVRLRARMTAMRQRAAPSASATQQPRGRNARRRRPAPGRVRPVTSTPASAPAEQVSDTCRAAAQQLARPAVYEPSDQREARDDREQSQQPPQQEAKHLPPAPTAEGARDSAAARRPPQRPSGSARAVSLARPARRAPSGATRSRRPSPAPRRGSPPASAAPAGSAAWRSGPGR